MGAMVACNGQGWLKPDVTAMAALFYPAIDARADPTRLGPPMPCQVAVQCIPPSQSIHLIPLCILHPALAWLASGGASDCLSSPDGTSGRSKVQFFPNCHGAGAARCQSLAPESRVLFALPWTVDGTHPRPVSSVLHLPCLPSKFPTSCRRLRYLGLGSLHCSHLPLLHLELSVVARHCRGTTPGDCCIARSNALAHAAAPQALGAYKVAQRLSPLQAAPRQGWSLLPTLPTADPRVPMECNLQAGFAATSPERDSRY